MMNRNILNPMMWTTGSGPTPTDYGIYRNQNSGLISLSSDGENWITISDKNLGASQVYNDGDTLSEENCGKYFQRGNNYDFPWTGNVTTSTTQVDASNYGPYYESNLFYNGSGNRSSIINRNLWGELADTLEARKGPCDDGFHIPTNIERQNLIDTMTDLGINTSNGDCLETFLKMPFAGFRSQPSEASYQDRVANYWSSSTYYDGSNVYCLSSSKSLENLSPQAVVLPKMGISIRPFKNISVVPSESWRKLYDGGDGTGIFWSAEEKIISISSDGENRITIADRNLGATSVYGEGDRLNEAKCGKLYQRGNNYGFAWSGQVESTENQVDATNYGPYYEGQVFRRQNSDWTNPANLNLWGGIANTTKARRGPCPKGFHVPSTEDHIGLIDTLSALGINTNNGICLTTYLKMPFAGFRDYKSGSTSSQDSNAHYWSSTAKTGSDSAYTLTFASYNLYPQSSAYRAYGHNVRPFKNESVTPDSTRTKLY